MKNRNLWGLLVICFISLFFISCSPQRNTVVLLTNQPSFASYAELFNTSQSAYKVIVEYAERPGELLSGGNSIEPDIVVGPWLKNAAVRTFFQPLSYLFTEELLSKEDFYPQLLELGNSNNKQYLLPVSFNLPVVIFASKNNNLLSDNFMLSIEEIRSISSAFNEKNKKKEYVSMGFSPRWDPDFMYVVSKLFGTNYAEAEDLFSYNEEALNLTINYLRDWSFVENTSTKAEDDFQFKYLTNSVYKQVTSGKCLFGYMKSNDFFTLSSDYIQNLDFRWLHEGKRVAVADKLIYLGICKKAKNRDAAEAFVLWLLNEETQRSLLERTSRINLTSSVFGISDGFSSLVSVNEHVFPLFYPILYGHLPAADSLLMPNVLPEKWESIKDKVIIPYISECVVSDNQDEVLPIEQRKTDWKKQSY